MILIFTTFRLQPDFVPATVTCQSCRMIDGIKDMFPSAVEFVEPIFPRRTEARANLSQFKNTMLSLCAQTFLPPICSALCSDRPAIGSSSNVVQSACSAFARMLVHLPTKHISQSQLRSFMYLDKNQSQSHRQTVAAGMQLLLRRPDLLQILFGAPPNFAETNSLADLDWWYEQMFDFVTDKMKHSGRLSVVHTPFCTIDESSDVLSEVRLTIIKVLFKQWSSREFYLRSNKPVEDIGAQLSAYKQLHHMASLQGLTLYDMFMKYKDPLIETVLLPLIPTSEQDAMRSTSDQPSFHEFILQILRGKKNIKSFMTESLELFLPLVAKKRNEYQLGWYLDLCVTTLGEQERSTRMERNKLLVDHVGQIIAEWLLTNEESDSNALPFAFLMRVLKMCNTSLADFFVNNEASLLRKLVWELGGKREAAATNAIMAAYSVSRQSHRSTEDAPTGNWMELTQDPTSPIVEMIRPKFLMLIKFLNDNFARATSFPERCHSLRAIRSVIASVRTGADQFVPKILSTLKLQQQIGKSDPSGKIWKVSIDIWKIIVHAISDSKLRKWLAHIIVELLGFLRETEVTNDQTILLHIERHQHIREAVVELLRYIIVKKKESIYANFEQIALLLPPLDAISAISDFVNSKIGIITLPNRLSQIARLAGNKSHACVLYLYDLIVTCLPTLYNTTHMQCTKLPASVSRPSRNYRVCSKKTDLRYCL